MNLERFIEQLNASEYDQPHLKIIDVCTGVPGFSAPSLMQILSMAVSNLEEDEIYMEIGTYLGRTLIGAMIENPTKRAIACDNFSQFNGTEEQLRANLNAWLPVSVDFHNQDYQDFFKDAYHLNGVGVGVYMYDANHDPEPTYDGLKKVVPFLSPHAVIILDDFTGNGIWTGIRNFLINYPKEATIAFAMRTNNFPVGNSKWWNGVIVMAWKEEGWL